MARRPGATGTVRIIGGRWKGHRLRFPAVGGLRPTPDRVRETLFNWLAPRLGEDGVVDLFAGSGALGIEAASRGVAPVLLVEKHPRVAAALSENLRRLPGASGILVERQDALRWLETADLSAITGIFLDPPYGSRLLEHALGILRRRAPASLSWLYLEFPSRSGIEPLVPLLPEGFRVFRQGAAGDVGHALVIRQKAG